jgi:RNA polymerase sigma factor (sigma-70 family)
MRVVTNSMNTGSAVKQQEILLFHYCRMQLPMLALDRPCFEKHLQRTFGVFSAKSSGTTFALYLATLHALDWHVACSCLEGLPRAWDHLFASRAGRSDCLLIDALRARAVRLYPRDEERQESAVAEFWSHLLVAEHAGSVPVLARYDGQRPLVPWLIRVFQNWHISLLRQRSGVQSLPDDDVAEELPDRDAGHWHEPFRLAASEEIAKLTETEVLILGLRLRYRLSQREVASLLGVHEGTVSRQTSHLRDRVLEGVEVQLRALGWTGDDLSSLVLTEMGSVLLDEPRLAARRLSKLLAARGKSLPQESDQATD